MIFVSLWKKICKFQGLGRTSGGVKLTKRGTLPMQLVNLCVFPCKAYKTTISRRGLPDHARAACRPGVGQAPGRGRAFSPKNTYIRNHHAVSRGAPFATPRHSHRHTSVVPRMRTSAVGTRTDAMAKRHLACIRGRHGALVASIPRHLRRPHFSIGIDLGHPLGGPFLTPFWSLGRHFGGQKRGSFAVFGPKKRKIIPVLWGEHL